MQVFAQGRRHFSSENNFGHRQEDENKEPSKYTKYDPEAPEPEIDPEEFKRMQNSLAKFS